MVESTGDDLQRPCKTFLLGPEYMAERLYELSPPEVTAANCRHAPAVVLLPLIARARMQDLTLATMLVRPSRQFEDDAAMDGEGVLTAERYGAVSCVYVVAEEDKTWSPEFQRRMASWSTGTEVIGLEGADHMPMFSKSSELSDLLVEISDRYI